MSTVDLQTSLENEISGNYIDKNITKHPLSTRELETSLFEIEETMDGLYVAPKTLTCTASSITDISVLESFKNLQFINLSSNLISDISPLLNLSLVHELDCSKNLITWIPEFSWPFLTRLNLDNNKITKLPRMSFPSLQIITLNGNLISSLVDEQNNCLLEEEKLPELHTLELRGNKIATSLPPLNKPLTAKENYDYQKYLQKIGLFHQRLKMLILPCNVIKTMASVYTSPEDIYSDGPVLFKLNPFGSRMGLVPNLVVLHLRGNRLRSLHGFTREAFTSLRYLNLRENRISYIEDLENLKELISLEHLILTGNPVERIPKFRIEVLVLNMRLKRVDKKDYLKEDLEEARFITIERLQAEKKSVKKRKPRILV